MEYVGDPFEKLLGFFIAVVILTFYIGVVNLLLMFVSFSVFNGNGAGYLASVAGVIPLWFYARYRARRYVLGRTRWRGVRFALEPAAWKYTGQALKHWFITIITAGILWPRMTFMLEKFRTDRTAFGDAKLQQGGRWQMLIPATYPFLFALIATALWAMWVWQWDPLFSADSDVGFDDIMRWVDADFVGASALAEVNNPQRLWAIPLLFLALFYGAIHYASVTKRIMANHKTIDGVALASSLSPRRIFMIYNLGYTISYFVLVFGVVAMVLVAVPLLGFDGFLSVLGEGIPGGPDVPRWVAVPVLILFYFTIFLMWSVFYNVFVTFPLMRHKAQTLSLTQADGFAQISQRKRDDFAEAEGFAEALDLGAAI